MAQESQDMTLAEALGIWCVDPLSGSADDGPDPRAVESAYAVLRRFLAGRCASAGAKQPGVVEDVVHGVLERLSRRGGPPDRGAAYLSAAVRNALVSHHRHAKRYRFDPDLLDILVDDSPPVGSALEAAQQGELLETLWRQALSFVAKAAEARRARLGARVAASLALLESHLSNAGGPPPTPSELRVARRHRQLAEDLLYQELVRAYHRVGSAHVPVLECPTREAALQIPQKRLLQWRVDAHSDPDLVSFLDHWLTFALFEARLRKRNVATDS